MPTPPDTAALAAFTNRLWDDEIVPALHRYIEVPAKTVLNKQTANILAKHGFVTPGTPVAHAPGSPGFLQSRLCFFLTPSLSLPSLCSL